MFKKLKHLIWFVPAAAFTLFIVLHSWNNTRPRMDVASQQALIDPTAKPADSLREDDLNTIPSTDTKHQDNEPAKLVSQAVKEQLRHIKSAYEQNVRFPAYSQPLEANDWNLLNPNAYIPKEMPLQDYPDISASIILEHYSHDQKQPLPIEVIIKSSSESVVSVTQVWVKALHWEDESPTIQLSQQFAGNGLSSFIGTVPASTLETMTLGENTLVAELYFDNSAKVNVTATFKMYDSQAELIAIKPAYVNNADLVIPVLFNVDQPGFYRVRANLFDKTKGTPISHINAAFQLTEENPQAELKVHSATLYAKQAPGPYVLKDFTIIRQPSFPGDKTGHGSSLIVEHEIEGVALGEYTSHEYENPRANESIVFLEKLSSD